MCHDRITRTQNRDRYLKKLIGFQDTEPVKVITGIRRCGKSSLLKLMIRHLRETGVSQEQIVEMNFESHDFRRYTSDEVYHYVKDRAVRQADVTSFLTSCNGLTPGRMRSIPSGWIWTATFM